MTSKKGVALVTGGAGGIGVAICQGLANKGYQVVAAYHPSKKDREEERIRLWEEMGIEVGMVAVDVTSVESCEQMAAEVKEKYGNVTVLVNCAGITRDKTFKKMEEDDWKSVIDVNLNSMFNVTKQFFNDMCEDGYGRIINISSINGKKGQFGQTNYSASKAGIHGFTMALAQEGARKGVTVNTISPGYTATEMTKAIPEEVRNQIVADIPVGRMGKPSEIAFVVTFLADERAGFITGQNISPNGGQFISF